MITCVTIATCILATMPFVHSQSLRTPPRVLWPAKRSAKYHIPGTDITLNCTAVANPQPWYRWTLDGKQVGATGEPISVNPQTGVLIITGYTHREEGAYQCAAYNAYTPSVQPAALSPIIDVITVGFGKKEVETQNSVEGKEGDYASLPCINTPISVPRAKFSWYIESSGGNKQQVVSDNNRIFVDNDGTLHFLYLELKDETKEASNLYKCGMYNSQLDRIDLASPTALTVRSGSKDQVKPTLRFGTKNALFRRTHTADLECVFSGNPIPDITWRNALGKITPSEKYQFESNGMRLRITNLEEGARGDTGAYTCEGVNTVGRESGTVFLKVMSGPIWTRALNYLTVPKGFEARFTCEARKPFGGDFGPLKTPTWFKNGKKMDIVNTGKYEWSKGNSILTIRNVQKNVDVICVQCNVSNEFGFEFDNGCLNVIDPIVVQRRPADVQKIVKGDAIDLTVIGTTDSALTLKYRWVFRNVSFENTLPPHITYNKDTHEAYINTSSLTDQQLDDIAGVYNRILYHDYQNVSVKTEVLVGYTSLRTPPRVLWPAKRSAEYHIPGTDITLNCTAVANPQPRYRWTLDGKQVVAGGPISVNPQTGVLIITGYTRREEGAYQCEAYNAYTPSVQPAALSPIIDVITVGFGKKEVGTQTSVEGKEGDYASLPCINAPISVPRAKFSWYIESSGGNKQQVVSNDNRIFVDNEGTLHFLYLELKDEPKEASNVYKCGMFNSQLDRVDLASPTALTVRSGSKDQVKPTLWFWTKNALFRRTQTADLECVFSGIPIPDITWRNALGKITSSEKYQFESNGMRLRITNLEEGVRGDTGAYTCEGVNSVGRESGTVFLKVMSGPIWTRALNYLTVPKGFEARFTCEARKPFGGDFGPLKTPMWFKDGSILDIVNTGKYEWSQGNSILTIKNVQKNVDVMCIQCNVSNEFGFEFDNGCLNVIDPIVVQRRPADVQKIVKGDAIDLTVIGTTDSALTLKYRWVFRNVSFENTFPPHVTYNKDTHEAYINTSSLTDQQLDDIAGVYNRILYHDYQNVSVKTEVLVGHTSLRTPPRVLWPAKRSAEYHIPGTDITLNCTAVAKPQPRYRWTLDGKQVGATGGPISVNPQTGVLIITGYTRREEGAYQCVAYNAYTPSVQPAALSPIIDVITVGFGKKEVGTQNSVEGKEGDYASLPCINIPISVPRAKFSWYIESSGGNKQLVSSDNNRIFVDNDGTLHFLYLELKDEPKEASNVYKCGMFNSQLDRIDLASPTALTVRYGLKGQVKPTLRFWTKNALFHRTQTAELECVFSGNPIPDITWRNALGKITPSEKYQFEFNGMHLRIINLEEGARADTGAYTCEGVNTVGRESGTVFLKVMSGPIWTRALNYLTVPKGFEARFTCEARKPFGGDFGPLKTPTWFKDGRKMHIVNTVKYEWSQGNSILTIKNVQKNVDVMCVQCNVSNEFGFEFDNGCLNVIDPIVVQRRPADVQKIVKGDAIDLTVIGTTDSALTLKYRWVFRNVSYENTLPPHVTYNKDTHEAYINTSSLTDQQLDDIAGLYNRILYHHYQNVSVKTEVVVGNTSVVLSPFPWWAIVIVVVLCCCRNNDMGVYVGRVSHA